MASFIVGYIFLIAGNSALMLVFLNSLSIFLSLIFQDFVAYILFAVGFHSLAKKYPAFGKAKILSYILAAVSTLAYLLSLAVPPLSAIVVGLFISVCVLLTRLYLIYMTVNVISGLDTDMFKSLDSGSLRTWWFIACVLHILCVIFSVLVLLGVGTLAWIYMGFNDFALIASCVFACYLNKALSLLIKG